MTVTATFRFYPELNDFFAPDPGCSECSRARIPITRITRELK
jgi:hypothetical protein